MRSVDERNALVMKYQPLVHKIARQMARMLPYSDYDDLVQDGQIILIHCCDENYRPERFTEKQFISYCAVRIRGELRRKYYKFRTGVQRSSTPPPEICSLDVPIDDEDYLVLSDTLAGCENVEQQAVTHETCVEVRSTMECLPPKERAVIDGVFYRDLRVCQIAPEIGVSANYASQLRHSGLQHLRKLIAA